MVALAVGRVAHPAGGALIGWLAFVVVFAALQYAGRLTAEDRPADLAYRWETSVVAFVSSAIVLGIAVALAYRRGLRETFALRRPRSWLTALLISGAIIVAMLVVSFALSPLLDPEQEQGLVPTTWDSSRAAQFGAFALAVTVVAPVVEELMFRGVGYTLLEPFGERVAVVGVGIAFALVHGLIEGFVIIAAFGIGLAYLRSRTRSIYPCVLLHGAFNATALLLGLVT
jgi:membrane protease YdiL (CAAX protease family)